jgi:hypothetical protein
MKYVDYPSRMPSCVITVPKYTCQRIPHALTTTDNTRIFPNHDLGGFVEHKEFTHRPQHFIAHPTFYGRYLRKMPFKMESLQGRFWC